LWVAFIRVRVFAEGGALCRVFTPDERCPGKLIFVIVQNLNEIGQPEAEL